MCLTRMEQICGILEKAGVVIRDISSHVRGAIIQRLLKSFNQMEDRRMKLKCKYPNFGKLILMIVLAILGGAKNVKSVNTYWTVGDGYPSYERIFKYDSVPSEDTFGRVLRAMDPEKLSDIFVKISAGVDDSLQKALGLKPLEYEVLNGDGQQHRGTGRENTFGDGKLKDVQDFHLFNASQSVPWGSYSISDKSNEIPKMQEALEKAGPSIRGKIVTFDAMNTQIRTVAMIADKGGDYLGGLKGNQGTLRDYAETIFAGTNLKELEDGGNFFMCRDIAHGQLEERRYYLLEVPLTDRRGKFKDWKKLRSIVVCVKTCWNKITGEETKEIRYYVTSLTDIGLASSCIILHWSVENQEHYPMDTVLMMDAFSVRDSVAVTNWDIIGSNVVAVLQKIQLLMGQRGKLSLKSIYANMSSKRHGFMDLALILLDSKATKHHLSLSKASQ